MMYSNKDNVNLLTSLLAAHGVRHAVVCPGSRNAPVVHNLDAHPQIVCHPVTDERSAGFYALGMAQTLGAPVAVCVTSGTALLNLAPAVAEAYYQHVAMVVVSADRPQEWIGQLDGQTLRQDGALNRWMNVSVCLPEKVDSDSCRWYCGRLLNEALLGTRFPQPGPVHINVPIAEPLFDFSCPRLPEARPVVRYEERGPSLAALEMMAGEWRDARRPMVVLGQHVEAAGHEVREAVRQLARDSVVLSEPLTTLCPTVRRVDEALVMAGDDDGLLPDYILYVGDMLVSKRLRAFLRRAENAHVTMVCPDGEIHDTTTRLDRLVKAGAAETLVALCSHCQQKEREDAAIWQTSRQRHQPFLERWRSLLRSADAVVDSFEPPFSQMAAVRYFHQQLEDMEYDYVLHYANSSAVRQANLYSQSFVFCNRGVNGIEGSLSTAAGCSVVYEGIVFCVIGDLSFFYDQNALWNQNLRGNLRIILLNNGRGGIFGQLPGLEQSPAADRLVSAAHHTTAQGICAQNDVGYLKASNMAEMQVGIVSLLTGRRDRPVVLEVFTDAAADRLSLKALHQQLGKANPLKSSEGV